MLMPSFCWPLGLGPKPVITRPLAGQRNLGRAPSAAFTASFGPGASATGVTMLAVCTGSGSAAAGFACATGVALTALDLAAVTRTPGITRRSPTLSLAVG